MNWKTGLIFGLILLTALFIFGWQLIPTIEDLDPADSLLFSRQSLVISFSRPMDPVSVYSHFSLAPSIMGDLLWNEEFTRANFTPDKPWPSGKSVAVTVESGAKSRLGLPLLGDRTWTLQVQPSTLIYLWPADGFSNLYLINPETGDTQQLTNEKEGILDYSISGDGSGIYYSKHTEAEGSAIISQDRLTGKSQILVNCDSGVCRSPQISPDSSFLAYEFIPGQSGIQPGIRVYDLETDIHTDLGNPDQYLDNPLWSPSGWLSFYNYSQRRFEFWNPDADERLYLPNETGGDGTWSADGRYFVCSEILYISETLAPRHLIMFDLVEKTQVDLSQGNFLEDLNPSFSPQGSYLAWSRKALDPVAWTPGRQLWVLDLNSEDASQLTDEIDFHHTSFAWHPDERQLVFVRYNQAKLSDPPEIWLINRDGTDKIRLIINGFGPSWIP